MRHEILRMLENNSRIDLHDLAIMLGTDESVVLEEIEKMGVPYEKLPGTGLIAIIEGGKPGKNKILRADIDALPLQEETENLKQPKVCVSEIPGRCHACGHDAHMAMLLGTMRILVQNKEELPGTVYCCFEEGEETNCGIDTMIEALEKYPIDECFAFHVYNELDAGKVNIVPGPRMAGTVGIGFHLKGRADMAPDRIRRSTRSFRQPILSHS